MTRRPTAVGALATAAGLAAVAVVSAGTDEGRIAAAALAGTALLVLGVAIRFAWAGLVAWGVAVLGASYAASLPGRGLDLGAAATGAGLLLTAELAAWSIEARRLASEEGAVMRIRASALAAVSLGSAAAGTLVLGVSVVSARGGYPIEALGAIAAAGAVLVGALTLRRRA